MGKFRVGISALLLLIVNVCFCDVKLFFAYLLALFLHEMAHIWVAELKGYKLKYFKFDMFGLSVGLEQSLVEKDAFMINLAGPIMNLIVCLVCTALYYLFPNSYILLEDFCCCNLVLCLFNLLPIYPLDGGKIFDFAFTTNKAKRVANVCVRCVFCLLFLWLFLLYKNYYCLIVVVFMLIAKGNDESEVSLFKTKRAKQMSKVRVLVVDKDTKIYQMLKEINNKRYTIFYCPNMPNAYVDEDMLITLAVKGGIDKRIIDMQFL